MNLKNPLDFTPFPLDYKWAEDMKEIEVSSAIECHLYLKIYFMEHLFFQSAVFPLDCRETRQT